MANTYGTLGTKISIGGQVASTVDTPTEFEALTWVEIGGTESISRFGDSSAAVNFTGLADARVRKNKGARDAGNTTLICGHDPADAGQLAMIAAEGTNKKYGFKVEIPDAVDDTYANSILYFRGLVSGVPLNPGGPNDTLRREFTIEIDSEIYDVPSALIGP